LNEKNKGGAASGARCPLSQSRRFTVTHFTQLLKVALNLWKGRVSGKKNAVVAWPVSTPSVGELRAVYQRHAGVTITRTSHICQKFLIPVCGKCVVLESKVRGGAARFHVLQFVAQYRRETGPIECREDRVASLKRGRAASSSRAFLVAHLPLLSLFPKRKLVNLM